jgi:hypothetical protein
MNATARRDPRLKCTGWLRFELALILCAELWMPS